MVPIVKIKVKIIIINNNFDSQAMYIHIHEKSYILLKLISSNVSFSLESIGERRPILEEGMS